MLFILNVDEEVKAVLSNNSPNACPFWNDSHTDRLEDSLSTYEFTCPAEHPSAEHVVAENYVAFEDLDGYIVLFKIKNVEENSENGQYIKIAYAENAAISELNTDILRPNVLKGYVADDAVDYMLAGTQWKKGHVDYLGAQDITLDNYETALAGLQMLPTAFGGELRYRITMSKNKITNRYIDLLEQRGTDTGKRFEYAKDIKGVRRVQDSTNIATAIIPVGKQDANGNRMNITSVNDGLDYIADEDARDRWSSSEKHLYGVYTNEDAQSPVELMVLGQKELDKRKNPVFTYEVDVALLEHKAGISHEDVRLGDSVKVIDLSFEPYLALDARIIEVIRSYADPTQDSVTLGEFVKQYITIPSIVSQMQKGLSKTKATADAAERVSKGTTPPDDTSLLWLDMSNASLYVWKKYEDTSKKWIPATTTEFEQVNGQVQTAQIADKAVQSNHINTAAIQTQHISQKAITTQTIAAGAITQSELNDGAVTSTKIASSAVGSSAIAPLSIAAVHVADAAIEANKIADSAVEATKLKDSAVTSAKIAPVSVQTVHINDAAITNAKVSVNAIQSPNIAPLAIQSAHIEDGTIGTTKIADATIDATKLKDEAVTSSKLAPNAVKATNIDTGAISEAKMNWSTHLIF